MVGYSIKKEKKFSKYWETLLPCERFEKFHNVNEKTVL